MLGKAIALAVEVHTGQKREGGEPYILHPLRMMLKMGTKEEMIVAVLHDTVEDGDDHVFERIQKMFPNEISEAVDCLSRRKHEDYSDYIERVMSNDLSKKIKTKDIEDNINALELPKLDEKHLKRIVKYHEMWNKIKAHK